MHRSIEETFVYPNVAKKSTELPFQVFIEREEPKAAPMTSSRPFIEWEKAFTVSRLCVVTAEWVPFEEALIQTGTDSCPLNPVEATHRTRRRS